jgi:hypothetical protein
MSRCPVCGLDFWLVQRNHWPIQFDGYVLYYSGGVQRGEFLCVPCIRWADEQILKGVIGDWKRTKGDCR